MEATQMGFQRCTQYWRDLYNFADNQRRTTPFEGNSAMRHCVSSCLTASEFGIAGAFVAGTANEFQGFVVYDFTSITSAVTNINLNPLPGSPANFIDLGNQRLAGKTPYAFQIDDFADNSRGFKCSIAECEVGGSPQDRCIKCCSGGR
jgi:hypothetical protein